MLTIIALVIALLFLSPPWSIVIVTVTRCGLTPESSTFFWWSRRRRRPTPLAVGAETIVGRTGIALDRLDPDAASPMGQVRIEGEIWSARSAEPIEPGASVAVRAVDGLVLEVEPSRRP